MTDNEFLDDLQRRAATSMSPIINDADWDRINLIMGAHQNLAVFPAGAKKWTVAPAGLYERVQACRAVIQRRVTARLKS